jgi:hypothetical protein
VIGPDFLTHEFFGQRFDIILMNPPFSAKGDRHVWVAHLRKAFSLLEVDGELSCIVPSGMWEDNSLRLFVELREWLLLHGATIEAHDDGAFKESGTGVKTATIKMSRRTARDIDHESNIYWVMVDQEFPFVERMRKLAHLRADSPEVQAMLRAGGMLANSNGCSVAMTPELVAELGREWEARHGRAVVHRDIKPPTSGQLDLL